MSRKIVVFAPHPDDETVGCGGTIAKRVSQGYDVLIVVMTDGKNAFSKVLGINSNPSPEELKSIRREELQRAIKILGVPVEKVIFLDFEDGKLFEHLEEAEKFVTQILKENCPEEVYFPTKKDFHKDHQATNRIVNNAIRKLVFPTLGYQYSIAQRFSRLGPRFDRFLSFFKHHIIWVDISDFISLKEQAMEEYVSEVAIISNKQKRPVVLGFKKHLKDKEAFYVKK